MRIKRYFAEDMRAAMRQVKQDQGADAVILSNKRVEGGIEIVAATDYEPELVNLETPSKKPSPTEQYSVIQEVTEAFEEDEDEQEAVVDTPDAPEAIAAVENPQVEWSQEPTLIKMRDEISQVRTLLEDQLAGLTWNHLDRQQPHRIKLLRDLTALGLDPQMTRCIVEEISSSKSPAKVWRTALGLLAKKLKFANSDVVDRGGLVAVVGTTGVGKTTTVAKLAARYALRYGADQVGLVTTDGFRIGAQEQLLTFGRILNVPIQAVSRPEDLQDALDQFADRGLVLVDTTGVGQRDLGLVKSLASLQTDDLEITILQALSATTQFSALCDSIRCFRQVVPVDGCIVTKIDEATSLGGIFSATTRYGLPITYLTNGQCVPEDIQCANTEQANMISLAVTLMKQHAEAMDEEYMASEFTRAALHA